MSEYHNLLLYVNCSMFDHLLPNTLDVCVIIGQYLMLLSIHKYLMYVNCFMFEQLLPNIRLLIMHTSHTWESIRMIAEVNKYMSDSFECRSWRSHVWGLCINSRWIFSKYSVGHDHKFTKQSLKPFKLIQINIRTYPRGITNRFGGR